MQHCKNDARPPQITQADHLKYAALIRAYSCTPLLVEAINALRKQSLAPEKIIIVDSSGNPEVSDAFITLGAMVVPYPKEPFNFSTAINIGARANTLPYTLIISSHMLVTGAAVIEEGSAAALGENIEVWYWVGLPDGPHAVEQNIVIDQHNFNGRNGLSNSMAMIPTKLILERPFREEVFSAEDQEWASYYMGAFKRPILRIVSAGILNENPNLTGAAWEMKTLNEDLAIGHFVDRRAIGIGRIVARFSRGIFALIRRRPERASLHFVSAWAMLKAHFRPPTRQSRYF